MHYNGISEIAEFDKFVAKHNVKNKKDCKVGNYSLAPYLQ